jgi:hypothetical protein
MYGRKADSDVSTVQKFDLHTIHCKFAVVTTSTFTLPPSTIDRPCLVGFHFNNTYELDIKYLPLLETNTITRLKLRHFVDQEFEEA